MTLQEPDDFFLRFETCFRTVIRSRMLSPGCAAGMAGGRSAAVLLGCAQQEGRLVSEGRRSLGVYPSKLRVTVTARSLAWRAGTWI